MGIFANSKEYLNLIQNPTTSDFENFFRLLLHELQGEAEINRWDALSPYNFTYYESRWESYYEVGIKIVLLSFENLEFILGVKCKISEGFLKFYIFESNDLFENPALTTIKSIIEIYIEGGFNNVNESFVDYLDKTNEKISRLVCEKKYSLKVFKQPDYRIMDIKHSDEEVGDNISAPF